jgi:hypothetical protein
MQLHKYRSAPHYCCPRKHELNDGEGVSEGQGWKSELLGTFSFSLGLKELNDFSQF